MESEQVKSDFELDKKKRSLSEKYGKQLSCLVPPPLFYPLTHEGWEVTDVLLSHIMFPHLHSVLLENAGELGNYF